MLERSMGQELKEEPHLEFWGPDSCLIPQEKIQGHDKQKAGKHKLY